MKFSQESLDKLRKIFKEDFNADLTDQELHDAAFNLTGYFDTLMQCAGEDIQEEKNSVRTKLKVKRGQFRLVPCRGSQNLIKWHYRVASWAS
ncbi:MAG: hypothetical protein UY80_C0038G0003 [Parcubacteria group bacterium GW2011_GWB1_53_43]|nr:MAG: hypothetical protein UY80_C0038G0003 [Parcubacteria group bacterium GW2011_GWB1_53_43]